MVLAKKKSKSQKAEVGKASPAMIEMLLGPTLLSEVESPQPTGTFLEGKELVALYFSASWCSPCQKFTPLLSKFYKSCAKANGLEIVFVSSDEDRKSFHEYFATMPWVAFDADIESVKIKHSLATALKAYRLPALVVLDVKSGHFVTDNGRSDIMETGGDVAKGKELISSWKSREAVPIGKASLSASSIESVLSFLTFVRKNPAYVVALMAVLVFTPAIAHLQKKPLLAVGIVYLVKRLSTGRWGSERNLPYTDY